MGLTENEVCTMPLFITVKEHVRQYKGMAHHCVITSFWKTMLNEILVILTKL